MKTTIHNERLLKYAQHLEGLAIHPEQQLNETLIIQSWEPNSEERFEVNFPIWLLDELIEAFPWEWTFHFETGDPVIVGEEDQEPIFLFLSYFHLDLDEFECFGDKKLKPDASPSDIAHMIFELVRAREANDQTTKK